MAQGSDPAGVLRRLMRLLLTRPAEDSAALRRVLDDRGHDVLVSPMLTIEALPVMPPAGPFDVVLATSANAFRHVPEGLAVHVRHLPCLVVGAATLAAARAAGFAHVEAADGDAASLLRLVGRRQTPADRLLYLAGRDRRPDLEAGLIAEGRAPVVVDVYAAMPATELSPDVREALAAETIDAVVHYSRRSAEVFARLAEAADVVKGARKARHICISAAVAEGLAALDAPDLRMTHRPDTAAVLAALDF